MAHDFHILLLNGPNLNLLGTREPEKYGRSTLTNAEHVLIERIHEARGNVDYIVINPAAFTHTSVALRDALLAVDIPFIEVHITNVHAREPFRHHSWLSDIAAGVICGLGVDGYTWALQTAVKRLSNQIK